MSLSSAQLSQFTAIVDKIIAEGDVDTITVKQVRNGLQAAVGQDLSEYKNAIKALIHDRFDNFQAATAPAPVPSESNGHSVNKESSEPSLPASTPLSEPEPKEEEEDEDISPPPKKKAKKNGAAVDSDAALAAKLQAQENTRSRSTRGGGAKPVKKRASAPKKKSSKKVGEDDDSDVLGSDGEKKEVVKKGGFHKEYLLSSPLSDLVGETQLSRPQVVKKIWDYIKAHDLQDPEDKRQIRCDEKMLPIFKTDRIHMFTMNKHLGNHLYPVEE